MSLDIEQAKAFIEENLKMIQSAQDVTDKLGFSYETLRKRFRNHEGITLWRYITRMRIERAKQLLLERRDLCCYHICDEVGFSSDVSGERIFRIWTGMTMLEYRRHNSI